MTTASRLSPGVLALTLLLTGCVNISSTYQPPIERRATTGPGSAMLGSMVSMSDPDAMTYIVRDVSPTVESGAWRWAFKRPELRFALASVKDVKLVVDLTVAKCDPGARGDTVSGALKPAILETGYQVMVPLFINEGDVLKIDTRDGKYLTRVATGG